MKKIVIAPDSFKGTLSSKDVCRIVSLSLEKRYPEAEIISFPVADGGEGTAEVFLNFLGGEKVLCQVKSPLGRQTNAFYVMLPDKTAVVETALASGITLEEKNNALLASSYGTGQLVKAALDGEAKRIFIGIGGSAMTDAGTGFLAALGAEFYDSYGNILYPCGENLSRISKINLSGLDSRVLKKEITVFCDVKNPLCGKNGAAYVFAPQKGADEKEVTILDRGLESFATLSAEITGQDFSLREGAGAAGGLGFALIAYLGAELKSGIETVLDYCGFEKLAKDADLIITGEGKMDSQSIMGKVPCGVARRCKDKRVIALVGVNEATEKQCVEMGISEVIETNPLHLPFETIKNKAEEMLRVASEKIML